MSEYAPQPLLLSLYRAERVLDVSAATILAWGESGVLTLQGQQVDVTELERFMDAEPEAGLRPFQPARLARALSVLPRMQTTWTTTEVADLLGCSRDVVVRLCDQGHVQSYSLQSGVRRITRLALAEYLTDHPGAQAAAMGLAKPAEPGTAPKPRRRKVQPAAKP